MKSLTFVFVTFALLTSFDAFAANNSVSANPADVSGFNVGGTCTGSYYNWGRAQNGYGYCYQYACTGDTLNQGQPVSNYFCEAVAPSYYDWGQAQNGWGYCYQYTAYGVTMNKGQPVSNYSCEARSPSYYSWSRSTDGYTRCYQYTGRGVAMNNGQPVSDYHCH